MILFQPPGLLKPLVECLCWACGFVTATMQGIQHCECSVYSLSLTVSHVVKTVILDSYYQKMKPLNWYFSDIILLSLGLYMARGYFFHGFFPCSFLAFLHNTGPPQFSPSHYLESINLISTTVNDHRCSVYGEKRTNYMRLLSMD